MNKLTNTLITTGVIALLVILCAIAWYKTGNKAETSSHSEGAEEKVAVVGDEKGPHGAVYIAMVILLLKSKSSRKG